MSHRLGDDIDPTRSSDSQWIAFTSERDGNSEVYVMDAAGKKQTNISVSSGADLQPAWRP